MPRFQESQLKTNFIKSLGENVTKGYKRKKLIDLPTPHDAKPAAVERATNLVEHDMDVEDGNSMDGVQPPLPEESDALAPPPPPTKEDTSVGSLSPSLDDLKAQQAELLQQLESNTSLNTSNLSVSESNVPSVQSQTHDDDPAPPPATSEVAKPVVFKGPSIEGTPLLKFSVYEKLPVGDNFKKGVSDVINFENLPDSTGKYEKMKDLLKNVRVKMDKLQNSDD